MKIVIDIEEEVYNSCMPYKDTPIISNLANYNSEIIHSIANGTPLAIRALKNEQSEQNVGMCQQTVGEMSEKQTDLIVDPYDMKYIRGGKPSYNSIKTELKPCAEKTDTDHYRVIDTSYSPYTIDSTVKSYSKTIQQTAEPTAEEPIKHFGAIECPNCGRLLMLEEQTYSWCKGCKEYDTEKHCCHRYSSFIRESLQENINAVLEDIKAEIAEEICLTDNPYTKQTEYTISHKKVLEIIDKHISGKEEQ